MATTPLQPMRALRLHAITATPSRLAHPPMTCCCTIETLVCRAFRDNSIRTLYSSHMVRWEFHRAPHHASTVRHRRRVPALRTARTRTLVDVRPLSGADAPVHRSCCIRARTVHLCHQRCRTRYRRRCRLTIISFKAILIWTITPFLCRRQSTVSITSRMAIALLAGMYIVLAAHRCRPPT